MKCLTGPAALVTMIVFVLLFYAPLYAAERTAQTDSLVWYTEALEADLAMCEIDGKATADSLRIKIEYPNMRIEWAEEDAPKWYNHPSLMFMGGAALGIIVTGYAIGAID